MDYKKAGVDVESGYQATNLIKKDVEKTFSKAVLGGLGGFASMFSLKEFKDFDEPVLVSGTDGVGTKLLLANFMDKYDTIGIDCVAMCVNDIICTGAKPLFFLDYIASGKTIPSRVHEIVKGIVSGNLEAKSSLVGGETAEMPDMYQGDDFDLAGFAVGIIDREKILSGKGLKAGDALIGISSSGVHSNGFSLIRKALALSKDNVHEYVDELGCSIGSELLKPTKIYVQLIHMLLEKFEIKSISNITGGGFFENIPRSLYGFGARINKNSWQLPAVFDYIQKKGKISDDSMFGTFNMGIGMVLAVDKEIAELVIAKIEAFGDSAFVIGELTQENAVVIC